MTARDTYLILPDMAVMRSAGLRGFRATVAELGGDAEALAARAGLPVAALDTDEILVPDERVAAALENAAAALGCPDLGLRIAARQDLGMLGALALAIRNSATVADALDCTSRYLFVHAQGLSLTLVPDPYRAPGIVALRYGRPPGAPDPAGPAVQGTDLGLGFVHRAITALVGGAYGLRGIELPYHPAAPVSVYEEFFGVPVRTRRPAALLRVPTSLAAVPLRNGDARLRDLAIAYLAEQAPGGHAGVVPRVRAAIHRTLGTAAPEIGTVAALLALHPRTLQRRLREHGTTFAEVLDSVRMHTARHYLTDTDLPMSQIARLLGLSEQSTFTRCCRRWWGMTPREVRRGG